MTSNIYSDKAFFFLYKYPLRTLLCYFEKLFHDNYKKLWVLLQQADQSSRLILFIYSGRFFFEQAYEMKQK